MAPLFKNKHEGKFMVHQLIEFEEGNLDRDETIALFQELVDTGVVWKLQGFYGRIAQELIEGGYINA